MALDRATLVRFIRPYLKTYGTRIAATLFCLVAAKIAQVGVPLVMKAVVDRLAPGIFLASVPVLLLLLYGALRFLTTLFAELRDRMFVQVAQRMKRELAVAVFGHLHDLPLTFHLERRVGSVFRDVQNGTEGVVTVLNSLLFTLVPLLLQFFLVAALLLWKFDGRFTTVSCGAVAAYTAFTLALAPRRRRISRQVNRLNAAASARAVDSLLNFEIVKACGERDFEMEQYDTCLEKCERAAVRYVHSLNALAIGQSLIVAIALTVLLFLVARGVASQALTLGDVILLNGLLIQMYLPLGSLGSLHSNINRAITDAERMFELLELAREVADPPLACDLPAGRATVEFRSVEFRYNCGREILHGVSFRILEGQMVAIVGHSGAGKSTLARLLARFYDPTSGAVMVNGVDLRHLRRSALRAAIGWVSQEAPLFNETIGFNITYGCRGAGTHGMVEAARAANIHEFIMGLPAAYDTVVGERGLKLSAGEKQRIAIARALVRNPSILIFDEASSALDSQSEKLIQSQLRRSCPGRATLLIAHRLSTVVDADEILVLDQGRIVERGQHQTLLQLGGRYARMWQLQLASPADEDCPQRVETRRCGSATADSNTARNRWASPSMVPVSNSSSG